MNSRPVEIINLNKTLEEMLRDVQRSKDRDTSVYEVVRKRLETSVSSYEEELNEIYDALSHLKTLKSATKIIGEL